jgi:hypothetical protein
MEYKFPFLFLLISKRHLYKWTQILGPERRVHNLAISPIYTAFCHVICIHDMIWLLYQYYVRHCSLSEVGIYWYRLAFCLALLPSSGDWLSLCLSGDRCARLVFRRSRAWSQPSPIFLKWKLMQTCQRNSKYYIDDWNGANSENIECIEYTADRGQCPA